SLLDGVILIGKLRELADTLQTLRPNHERRRDLRVPMLRRMQIQHELNQCALEFRAPIRIKHKTAARQPRRAREIHQLQALAQFNVRLRLEVELWLLAV